MLHLVLHKLIRTGDLVVAMPDGRIDRFGDGSGETVAVRCRDRATALKLALHPDLYLGECYMDGSLVLEKGSLWDLLDLVGRNLAVIPPPSSRVRAALWSVLRMCRQVNARVDARQNVARHYDLSEAMFRTFLDEDMQYSCAYFRDQGETLDYAQKVKRAHIAAKLALQPGQTVLDIGCGWGGLAIDLALHEDVRVCGISLSVEQLRVCRQRADALGLGDRVRFELRDYRDVRERFDRIVSVGMLEHVGVPNYPTFYKTLSRCLAPSGVALIHSIGRSFGPSYTSSFIRKYIFPGGYAPALSQLVPSIETARLRLTDVEVLRLHYAETLRRWRERFLAKAGAEIDPKFRRMWEFYLASSEMGFRYLDFVVFQTQLTHEVDVLPVTRRYIAANEDKWVEPAARQAAE